MTDEKVDVKDYWGVCVGKVPESHQPPDMEIKYIATFDWDGQNKDWLWERLNEMRDNLYSTMTRDIKE